MGSLGLPDDVTKLVTKSFDELKGIPKELNKDVNDKQLLEHMQRDAKTEYETKDLDKDIVAVTKALSIIRKNKVDRHSRMQMDVSQLCDRRNDEIERKAEAARRRDVEEKRQKTREKASKLKENKDRCLLTVATDAIPLR